jgi:tetratricopeptide (TPR) repeat protein
VRWLAQDVLAVLAERMAQAEWPSTVRLLSDSFDLLLQEGYAGKLEEILRALEVQVRDNSPTANLFRMALANQAGKLALVMPDISTAQSRFKLAHEIGQSLAQHFVNEPDYLREMSRTLLGLATCLLDSQQAQAGLDLIHSKLADYIFGGLGESFLTDRNLLSGQLMAELGKPAQALEYFQAVYDSRQAAGLNLQAQAALPLQADCYRQLGETSQALEIYTHLYKEMPHPIGLRVELGLSLAGCLAENRKFSQALSVLGELEGWLADYSGWEAFKAHFARLWKYRALVNQELGEKETALACANRSLEFWRKIPESAPEQAQMRALIDQIKTE